MTPPPNFGHFWVIFEEWSQTLPSTKLFCHGFGQSCSAMATQKLEGKVQQHDENAESSKTGCRSPSSTHGKAYQQVPALICDSFACRIVCAAAIWGGYFAHREKNSPPKYLGNKYEIVHLNFIISPPFLHNFGLQHQVRKPPLPNLSFPYEDVFFAKRDLSIQDSFANKTHTNRALLHKTPSKFKRD